VLQRVPQYFLHLQWPEKFSFLKKLTVTFRPVLEIKISLDEIKKDFFLIFSSKYLHSRCPGTSSTPRNKQWEKRKP